MSVRQKNGQWGEALAAGFLEKQGLEILERNWRYRREEIDLIARENGILVFVEVKSRSDTGFGRPEEMVGRAKKIRLMDAAAAYVRRTGYEGEIRFDIVGVTGPAGQDARIEHFPDAFYPGFI